MEKALVTSDGIEGEKKLETSDGIRWRRD